jgi:putative transposase
MLHKERKLNRLKGYDYSQSGWYYVTICTKDRKELFGKMQDNVMILNSLGSIVKQQWIWLEQQYQYIELDEYVVMPNHFHGIIIIHHCNVGNGRDHSLQPLPTKIKPLHELIGAFKTTSSKLIHKECFDNFQWQKSFHDHIIRNEEDYIRIKKYIKENPQNWEKDEEYIKLAKKNERQLHKD